MNQENNSKHKLEGLSLDQRDAEFIDSLMPILRWLYLTVRVSENRKRYLEKERGKSDRSGE